MLLFVQLIGTEALGAQRWLSFAGFNFQPSEFAKITSILTKDIELKHKHIEDLKKFNRAIIDKYEDKYVEFDTANKELSKENTRLIKDNIELTRAYNSLAHLGKFAEEEGIDIKKHNGKLPENSKNYKFSQKHTLLESCKVRSEYKLTPKKGKKDEGKK